MTGIDSFATSVFADVLRYLPEAVTWLTGIVVAVIMLRRGGGRAEKLLLAGFILSFLAALSGPLVAKILLPRLYEASNISRAQISWAVSVPRGIISFIGFVCLVWAFWLRFGVNKKETPVG